MLRLRKVELFGFKSFADRTAIAFPGTGIAGVVGPNGCGKSNIADAILWVLGEQSAKTLRSGRMADCIFSGTDDRPPTNLAEVSLTLVDPDAEAAGEIVSDLLFRTDDPEPEEPEELSDPVAAAPEDTDATASQEDADAKPKRNRLGMKLEAGDIVVTRRLYRDGKSEYYLNGNYCRLRDIQNLFMGTGLGPESYAIIEQGRIGQILSSRPSDRRALLEEAAGVTKYKTQKRLAEGKLAAARQNLLRVNDIFEEVTKQLASLKRQASRARRYRELKDESVALRRVLLATQLEGLSNIESTLDARTSEKASRVSALSSELAALEEGQTESQSRQFELESRVRQEQNRVGELMVAMERAQAGLTDNLRQQEETRQKLEQLEQDRSAQSGNEERLEREITASRAQLAESRSAVEEITVQTDTIGAEASQIGARIEELASALAAAQQIRTRTVEDLAVKRAELGQTAKSLQELEQRSDALRESVQSTEAQIRQTTEETTTVRTRYETARGDSIQAKDLVVLAEQNLEACLVEHSREKKASEDAREALTTAAAQEEALNDLIVRRTAFAEPVRKLLLHGDGRDDEIGATHSRTESEIRDYESGSGHGELAAPDTVGDISRHGGDSSNDFKAVGVLADFVEFDSRYSELLQTFLKEELEYVVVDTLDSARDGLSLLRDNMAGHATFLIDSFGQVPIQMPASHLPAPRGAGLIGSIGNFLTINDPLGNEAKRALPRLADTYLVENTAVAEALAADYPRHRFLSPDGTCYQGRLVSGGTPSAHGAYKLEQDALEATGRRADIEPKAMALSVSADELDARRQELEIKLANVRQMLAEQERQLTGLEQELLAVEARKSRLQDSLTDVTAAQQSCNFQRKSLTANQEHASAAIRQLEATLSAGAAEITRLTDEHATGCASRDSVQPRLAGLQSRRAALEERLTARKAEVARLEEDTQRQADARRNLDTLEESLTALRGNLQGQEEELRQRVETCRGDRELQEKLCAEFDTERDQLRVQVTEKEAVVRQRRRELDAAREEKSAIDIEQARIQSDRQHLDTAVQSEFGLTGDGLRQQVEERLEGEALQEAELRDGELRRKLDNIGPVNMMALEEFQECEQRHSFLTEQREDLMASMDDIRRTIAELDEIAHRKFAEAFEIINSNYQNTFKTLFGGGKATLRLTESDDPSEAGVELICQPPGKRLQNVMLLSGGEKALAALALLIAIFRYAPSPFCILDEVDAPLDDTNIGRFTRLIEDMAPETQFILVTHSKKTMESAALLYGVTMQNAVSQVVSVRFEEAATHAAA